MEKVCIRCHKPIPGAKEGTEICADCLRKEFAAAAAPLEKTEQEELAEEYKAGSKRRQERAERMQKDYKFESFTNYGAKLRVVFSFALYGICLITFVLSSGLQDNAGIGMVDDIGERVISLLFCAVAGVLMFSASARHPFIGNTLAFLMLLSGWFLPDIRALSQEKQEVEKVVQEQPAETTNPDDAQSGRALKKEDLDVFAQVKQSAPQMAHYAVYMTSQDTRTRAIVRDALSRLLGAEYTRAYTRGDGALYVVTNVRSRTQNISRVLSRFGRITYSAPADGVYELRFDPEKVNMVSSFPAEVLTNPGNSSFVSANLSELTSVDAMRIRAAALNLGNADVKMLRREVRDSLLRVIQDPWSQDFDTYTALAQALVVYAEPHDKQVTEACYKYFQMAQTMSMTVPQSVINYLVSEIPEQMTEPLVNLWLQNPVAWTSTLAQLGDRVLPLLTKKLTKDAPLRTVNSIIKYFKDHGNASCIPAIEPFTENPDSIIRHTAQETINALKKS